MTNDPGRPGRGQPPTPEEPQSGQPGYGRHSGSQPEYGQPRYGGQPPEYRQYGQEYPQQYGQPAPTEQYPAQGYGQQQPYEQQPGYGQQRGYEQQQQPYEQPPAYDQYQQYGQGYDQYGQQYDQYGQQYRQYDPYGQQYAQPEYGQPPHSAPPTQQLSAVGDPYAPGRYGPPPAPPKKGKGGLVAIVIGSILLLLCGGGGILGAVYLSNDSSGSDQAGPNGDANTTTSPTAPTGGPTQTDGPATTQDKISRRTSDPAPVTVAELTSPTYTGGSGTFTKTGDDTTPDCAAAVDKNAGQLIKGLGCTQAVSITAANSAKGCVVTFGILNMPDANSARRVIDGMRGGTLGSFVPKHHGASAEGTAGKGQSTWWFITRPDGHFVTFATGAYASGDRVVNRDPTMVACDNDMLKVVHERLASRR